MDACRTFYNTNGRLHVDGTSPSTSTAIGAHDSAADRYLSMDRIAGYDPDFFANNYFEYEQGNSEPIVKGRLRASFQFWKDIGASSSVLNVIQIGYQLLFIETPQKESFKNNKSAISYSSFVSEAILDLLNKGLVVECFHVPHIVNPLSVSVQSSGKLCLILDLRFVNQFLWKEKVHFEDWNIAISYFNRGDFLFTFDLKSGYHHVEIFPEHTKFLSFSWDFGEGSRYFFLQVLPFGLATAPFILPNSSDHWFSIGVLKVILLFYF